MDVDVLEGINVEIPGGRLTGPDVAIVDGRIADTNPTRYQPSAVHLVVEIVSPGSKAADRAIKPELYADARIPFYWRLELEPEPALFPYVLRGDRYENAPSITAGSRARVPAPFTVDLDPADLLRR
jgi:Uma2 family endonuclease